MAPCSAAQNGSLAAALVPLPPLGQRCTFRPPTLSSSTLGVLQNRRTCWFILVSLPAKGRQVACEEEQPSINPRLHSCHLFKVQCRTCPISNGCIMAPVWHRTKRRRPKTPTCQQQRDPSHCDVWTSLVPPSSALLRFFKISWIKTHAFAHRHTFKHVHVLAITGPLSWMSLLFLSH